MANGNRVGRNVMEQSIMDFFAQNRTPSGRPDIELTLQDVRNAIPRRTVPESLRTEVQAGAEAGVYEGLSEEQKRYAIENMISPSQVPQQLSTTLGVEVPQGQGQTQQQGQQQEVEYGMSGADVAEAQGALSSLGYDLEVDGAYGPKTAKTVKKFQKEHGLKQTGRVDQDTLSVLRTLRGEARAERRLPDYDVSQVETVERPPLPEDAAGLSNIQELFMTPQGARFLADIGAAISPEGTVGQRLGQAVSAAAGRELMQRAREGDTDALAALTPEERQQVFAEQAGMRELDLTERSLDIREMGTLSQTNVDAARAQYLLSQANLTQAEMAQLGQQGLTQEQLNEALTTSNKQMDRITKSLLNFLRAHPSDNIQISRDGEIGFAPEAPFSLKLQAQQDVVNSILADDTLPPDMKASMVNVVRSLIVPGVEDAEEYNAAADDIPTGVPFRIDNQLYRLEQEEGSTNRGLFTLTSEGWVRVPGQTGE